MKTLKDHTAGSPQNEKIIWTDLSCTEIKEKLESQEIIVSRRIVKQLLSKNGYKKRKIIKRTAINISSNRNEQFEKINKLKQQYVDEGNPVISCDTKKKEFIGNLFRKGTAFSQVEMTSYDHDFPNLAEGTVIPYGIYDVSKNSAYINIGTSCDTSEFATDSIKEWWLNQGKQDYPNARSVLVLVDGGGSNSSRVYLFKEALQNLVNEIGVEIRIAHYPPYTSKWNPIEHRLFPHVTRAMEGVALKDYEHAKKLIEKTTTKTGLTVIVNVIKKIYTYGKKVAEGFKENMKIIFDDHLSKWNYKAVPQEL